VQTDGRFVLSGHIEAASAGLTRAVANIDGQMDTKNPGQVCITAITRP
jgi:hypothetical protein